MKKTKTVHNKGPRSLPFLITKLNGKPAGDPLILIRFNTRDKYVQYPK